MALDSDIIYQRTIFRIACTPASIQFHITIVKEDARERERKRAIGVTRKHLGSIFNFCNWSSKAKQINSFDVRFFSLHWESHSPPSNSDMCTNIKSIFFCSKKKWTLKGWISYYTTKFNRINRKVFKRNDLLQFKKDVFADHFCKHQLRIRVVWRKRGNLATAK